MKIDLKLDKTYFYPGDKLNGEVLLNIDEILKIRGLYIEITCVEGHIVKSGSSRGWSKETLFKKKFIMEERKQLKEGEYNYKFEIDIPNNLPPSYEGKDIWVRWRLKTYLDIPYHPDVSKKIPVMFGLKKQVDPNNIKEIVVRKEFMEISLDKDILDWEEALSGQVKIIKLPKKVRRLILKIVAEEKYYPLLLITKTLYENTATIREFLLATENTISEGKVYNFHIEPKERWPINYEGRETRLDISLKFILDIPFKADIQYEIPLTIACIKYEKKKMKSLEEEGNILKDKIIQVLKDGEERDLIDIHMELDMKWDVDEIREICEELVEENRLEVFGKGTMLKKYKLKT